MEGKTQWERQGRKKKHYLTMKMHKTRRMYEWEFYFKKSKIDAKGKM